MLLIMTSNLVGDGSTPSDAVAAASVYIPSTSSM